jgi:hypothetical protein
MTTLIRWCLSAVAAAVLLGSVAAAQSEPAGGDLVIRVAEDQPGEGLARIPWQGADDALYAHPEPLITTKDIESARVVVGSWEFPGRIPSILVRLRPDAAKKLHHATESPRGRRLALVVDGAVARSARVPATLGEAFALQGLSTPQAQGLMAHLGSEDGWKEYARRASSPDWGADGPWDKSAEELPPCSAETLSSRTHYCLGRGLTIGFPGVRGEGAEGGPVRVKAVVDAHPVGFDGFAVPVHDVGPGEPLLGVATSGGDVRFEAPPEDPRTIIWAIAVHFVEDHRPEGAANGAWSVSTSR